MGKIKFLLYKIKLKWQRKSFRRNMLASKNVVIDSDAIGYQNVFYEGYNGVPARCQFIGTNIRIGYKSTLGYNNLLGGAITIGKYCQLGSDVAFHASNHPMSYMTTYINKNLFDGALKQLKEDKKITLGNDVWVGHGVIILGNVNVGNGAILAAGSVITKDVEPYTIVAGVPAKTVRKRFSVPIIQEIEDLKWWDKSDKELEELKPLFFKNFTDKKSIYE